MVAAVSCMKKQLNEKELSIFMICSQMTGISWQVAHQPGHSEAVAAADQWVYCTVTIFITDSSWGLQVMDKQSVGLAAENHTAITYFTINWPLLETVKKNSNQMDLEE